MDNVTRPRRNQESEAMSAFALGLILGMVAGTAMLTSFLLGIVAAVAWYAWRTR